MTVPVGTKRQRKSQEDVRRDGPVKRGLRDGFRIDTKTSFDVTVKETLQKGLGSLVLSREKDGRLPWKGS